MSGIQEPDSGLSEGFPKSRRRRQRLRRNKIDIPSTERRTLKQAFKNYRERRKSVESQGEKRFSLRRWRSKSRKSMRISAGEASARQTAGVDLMDESLANDQTSRPRFGPKIHYREQASTESLLQESQGLVLPVIIGKRFAAAAQFDRPVSEISRSKSAPVDTIRENIERANNHFGPPPHESRGCEPEAGAIPSNTPEYKEHFRTFDPRCNQHQIELTEVHVASIPGTASTVSTKTTTEPKNWSETAGSGVMKRIEASVLSFFSFAIPKNSSTQPAYDSRQTSKEASTRGLSLPFFKGKNSNDKTPTPVKGTSDYVDYSIYGNHAKYFL